MYCQYVMLPWLIQMGFGRFLQQVSFCKGLIFCSGGISHCCTNLVDATGQAAFINLFLCLMSAEETLPAGKTPDNNPLTPCLISMSARLCKRV
jgi:hypothetical protein